MRRIVKLIVFSVITVLPLTEVTLRYLGIADVPIRSANNVTGYIPLTSQSGVFVKNRWEINELSMISRKPFRKNRSTIVIAGDSVVFGGNLLDQSERVGERLDEMLSSKNVYSVADGSWSFKNQINYLLQYRDELAGTEHIIFVLNSEDFGAPSSWRCKSFHPLKRPYSAYILFIEEICIP
jgi:hypothetical protein